MDTFLNKVKELQLTNSEMYLIILRLDDALYFSVLSMVFSESLAASFVP